MKNENLEKYIGELSPELQEKARECKDMAELNALLAENDAELSEDALQAVAGGCSISSEIYDRGDSLPVKCPDCKSTLYYWDMCRDEKGCINIIRMYCNNPSCGSYQNGLWYADGYIGGSLYENTKVYRY